MKSIIQNIKKAWSPLLFDRNLVRKIRKHNVSRELLYTQLLSGRITLQEYLKAI